MLLRHPKRNRQSTMPLQSRRLAPIQIICILLLIAPFTHASTNNVNSACLCPGFSDNDNLLMCDPSSGVLQNKRSSDHAISCPTINPSYSIATTAAKLEYLDNNTAS